MFRLPKRLGRKFIRARGAASGEQRDVLYMTDR